MLKSFFILCSGADKDIVTSCSNGEQNKYAGIGATVFFTAIMAFVACSYALYTVFDNVYMATFFGLIWGLLIFNLDRFIVSTIKKRDSFIDEFIQASPRIEILREKLLPKEVLLKENNEMAIANKKQVANFFKTDVDKNQASIDSLKTQLNAKEKEVAALYQSYITEAEGTAGTKKMGKGPIYKEKREAFDLVSKQLDSLKVSNGKLIAEKETKGKTLQADLDKKVSDSQPIIDSFDGIMARINALDKLPFLPSLFIMLLFLAIETSPIIAKLLASKSEYDYKLEDAEISYKTVIEQNSYQRDLQKKTDASIYDEVYAEIKTDKELYNLKKKNSTEIMKIQSENYLAKFKS